MSERFHTLFASALEEGSTGVRKVLKSWSTKQRAAAYKEIGSTLNRLAAAFSFGLLDRSNVPRFTPVEIKAALVDSDERSLAALGLGKKDVFFVGHTDDDRGMNPDAMEYDRRAQEGIRCLIVGLGTKLDALRGLRPPHDGFPTLDALGCLETLLDRPDSWKLDVVADFVQAVKPNDIDPVNLAQAVTHALTISPVLRERLRPTFQRVALTNGYNFGDRGDEWMEGVDEEIIVAGLAADAPSGWTNQVPISIPETRESIVALAAKGRVSRQALISLCLQKMRLPLRPGLAAGWLSLFEALALSPQERAEHHVEILELVEAPWGPTARSGLNALKAGFEAGEVSATDAFELVRTAMAHPTQAAARQAFRFAKQLAKAGSDARDIVARAAAEELTTPHKGLRLDMAKWLATKESELEQEVRTTIEQRISGLDSETRDVLGAFTETSHGCGSSAATQDAIVPNETEAASPGETYESDVALPTRRIPGLEDIWTGPRYRPFQSPEELGHALLDFIETPPSAADLEKLLPAFVDFDESRRDRAFLRLIEPVIEVEQDFFNVVVADPANPIGILARFWVAEDKSTVPESRYLQGRTWVSSRWWHPRFMAALGTGPDVAASSLATPTHHYGWLDPRELVARLLRNGAHRPSPLDLAAALGRLIPDEPVRAEALATFVKSGLECDFSGAIVSALGGATDLGMAGKVRTRAGAELVLTALRARFGTVDLKPYLGTCAGSDLFDFTKTAEYQDATRYKTERKYAGLRELWFCVDEAFHDDWLEVYLSNPYGYGYDFEAHRLQLLYSFPMLGQEAFDEAARRLPREPDKPGICKHIGKHDKAITLLELGHLPWIDVRERLSVVALVLGSRHPNHRDRAAELLLHLIEDGRTTPGHLGESIAKAIDDGLTPKPLCAFLEELPARKSYGRVLAAYLGTYVLRLASTSHPRLVAPLLGTLASLSEDAGLPIAPTEWSFLEHIIENGSKSHKDRAKRVIDRGLQLPSDAAAATCVQRDMQRRVA